MNENQTTYPTGAQDEEEIDLVALMVTLLHKLKPILLTAVVCAVIAGGLAGVKILCGGAVSAEDQVAYEEALAEYQQKEKDYEFAVQQTSSEDVQNLQSQLVELQSARQALDDNLASAKSTWESAEEPALGGGAASSVAKYLLIGFLLGGVLACGVVVVKFLLDGMVYSASELNRSTGLPVLGALASDRTKKAGKLDAKLYQMEGRPDGSADAEMLCLMAQTIRSRAPEAKNILVTGDLPADQLEALAAALQATEPLRGQSVTAAESILKAAATVPHVVAADAIVLAADCTVTRTDAVREQNEKIVRLGKQILGCIVYE